MPHLQFPPDIHNKTTCFFFHSTEVTTTQTYPSHLLYKNDISQHHQHHFTCRATQRINVPGSDSWQPNPSAGYQAFQLHQHKALSLHSVVLQSVSGFQPPVWYSHEEAAMGQSPHLHFHLPCFCILLVQGGRNCVWQHSAGLPSHHWHNPTAAGFMLSQFIQVWDQHGELLVILPVTLDPPRLG